MGKHIKHNDVERALLRNGVIAARGGGEVHAFVSKTEPEVLVAMGNLVLCKAFKRTGERDGVFRFTLTDLGLWLGHLYSAEIQVGQRIVPKVKTIKEIER